MNLVEKHFNRTTCKSPYLLAFIAVVCLTLMSCSDSSVSEPTADNQIETVVLPTSTPIPTATPEPTPILEIQINDCDDIPDPAPRAMCEAGLEMGLDMEEMMDIAESMGVEEMMEMAESMDMEEMMEMAESMDMEEMMEMAEFMDMDMEDMMDMAESMDMEEMMESMDMEDMMDMAESMDMEDMMDMAESMDMESMDMAESMDMESMDMEDMMESMDMESMMESMLSDDGVDECDAETDMMKRMMCKMTKSMGSGQSDASEDQAPKLHNLMMQNLGPWDQATETFGDIKFDSRYAKTVFDDFGMLHNPGQTTQYDNPTFEFKAPADAIVLSPISGVVTMLNWQPTTSYLQDDWDMIIAPSNDSKWGVNLDHIVSIDCDRSIEAKNYGYAAVLCELPITINGEVVTEGTVIEAGQVLGYVGNWPDTSNSGINGRTELTLFEYIREGAAFGENLGVINHCPTMNLDDSVESVLKAKIQELMDSYETWSGDSSAYPQDEMVSPGCRYRAIEESSNGVTTPVTD